MYTFKKSKLLVLIVAKCIVNFIFETRVFSNIVVLIVAKCIVNAEELDKIKTMWEY